MRVFLDDDRNHGGDGWTMVRTVPALMRLIDRHGDRITHISFDNDLCQPVEGWEGLRDIIERLLDDPLLLPALRHIQVHSLNGGAADRMESKARNAVEAGVWNVTVERLPAYDGIHPIAAEDSRVVTVFE
jgi:hypothetical protein